MTPKRIRRRRTEPLPPGALYVGRPTRYGNPFRVGGDAEITAIHHPEWGFSTYTPLTPELAVALYRELWHVRLDGSADTHPEDRAMTEGWRADIAALEGHDLACWCPLEQACHGDVLLELANPGP